MSTTEQKLTSLLKIQQRFAADILETHSFRGDETALIKPPALRAVAEYLKNTPELDFNFLMDLTAVDYLFFAGGRSRRNPVSKSFIISFRLNITSVSVSKFPSMKRIPKSIHCTTCGRQQIGMSGKCGICMVFVLRAIQI